LQELFFEEVVRDDMPKLHLVIALSGTVHSEHSTVAMREFWRHAMSRKSDDDEGMDCSWSDMFILVYDRVDLIRYSRTIGDAIEDKAISMVYTEFLKQIVGHALVAAISLPMSVANVFNLLNNSFVICEARSKDAGLELHMP